MFESISALSEEQRPSTIWIVDDSPLEVQLISRALGCEYRIESFGDGASLLERCATTRQLPDLLLLDWVLPDITGEEVCRFLRATPETNGLAIILVTASRISVNDVVAGLHAGANDYISKPFSPEELRARVDAIVRAQRLRDAMQRQSRQLALVALLAKRLIAAGPSVSAVLEALCNTLVNSMGDGCLAWNDVGYIASAHRNPLAAAALRRLPPAERQPMLTPEPSVRVRPRIWTFTSRDAARERLPVFVHPYLAQFEIRSLVVLPLYDRSNLRGTVALWRDDERDGFGDADLTLLAMCTDYCSLPLENAELYEAEQRTRARLDATLDQLPVGVIVADEQGKIRLCNQVSREILGSMLELASGNEAFAVPSGNTYTNLPGASFAAGAMPLERALGGEVVRNEEVIVRLPSGEVRTIRASGAPVLSSTGARLGGVVALEDITEQKIAAREREQVSQFQERFIGILGHDLRNPLNAITMAAEVLARMQSDPRLTARILASADRMRRMIGQLLDLTQARIGGGIVLSKRVASLGEVLHNVVDELQTGHPQCRFELQIDPIRPGLWDTSRLEQVLSNIISNAIAYGRPGEPLRIRLGISGGETVCEIHNQNADQGAIPAELQTALFEPFRRGNDEYQRSQGLGLGLFIAKTIVVAHGGHIEVESTQEHGTTFRIRMPIAGPDPSLLNAQELA